MDLTKKQLYDRTKCLPPCSYYEYKVVSKVSGQEGYGNCLYMFGILSRNHVITRLPLCPGDGGGDRGGGGVPVRRALPHRGVWRSAGPLPRSLLSLTLGHWAVRSQTVQKVFEIEINCYLQSLTLFT